MLSLNQTPYVIPVPSIFSNQEQALPILASMRTSLSSLKARIISETLPSDRNGNSFCGFLLNCDAEDMVSSMEIIESLLADEMMRIQQMTISFDPQRNTFIFSCSFSPVYPVVYLSRLLGENKESIPAAFGYRAADLQSHTPSIVTDTPEWAEYTKIGVIRDEDNNAIVYYRNNEGKIITQEE
jgi:hypothetical protein